MFINDECSVLFRLLLWKIESLIKNKDCKPGVVVHAMLELATVSVRLLQLLLQGMLRKGSEFGSACLKIERRGHKNLFPCLLHRLLRFNCINDLKGTFEAWILLPFNVSCLISLC